MDPGVLEARSPRDKAVTSGSLAGVEVGAHLEGEVLAGVRGKVQLGRSAWSGQRVEVPAGQGGHPPEWRPGA